MNNDTNCKSNSNHHRKYQHLHISIQMQMQLHLEFLMEDKQYINQCQNYFNNQNKNNDILQIF
ncbi:unnamed protein product [Paramecium sonneborni]|uniref:Uncharacterized protein n=1 Tax=Paramecium sonneborni TaxID=65129 RepID=A0A8S1PZK5_9CILI|nr:unnamed protein product [Paramecium sonneborni]